MAFSLPNGELGKHVIRFIVDLSSSVPADKKNDILIFGKDPRQVLEGAN